MIAELLPAAVVCREAFDDRVPAPLFPEENATVAAAVDKRRREFATARRCAREALAELGYPALAIPSGPAREPCWPANVVGSITHCEGYRGAVVARADAVTLVGTDAEPHQRLPSGVLQAIALPPEVHWVQALAVSDPSICWDRLLFSAKESVYKAWYPLARRWLGFEEALITVDPQHRTFTAQLRPAEPLVHNGRPLDAFHGRWMVRRGLVLTATAQLTADCGRA